MSLPLFDGITIFYRASRLTTTPAHGDYAACLQIMMETITVSPTRTSKAHVEALADAGPGEVLSFLAERPTHTAIMAGLLREHGPSVPTPQGTFYGCRSAGDRLEGVALVGRATMFEARTAEARAAFARLARASASVRMIMGEEEELREFWRHYSPSGRAPRLSCRELFYRFTRGEAAAEGVAGLRRATLDELEQIVSAHAEMVKEETGVNPLETDPLGFRLRCAARVARGKVWALVEKGELIFKAELITETPHAAYLEGVWVNPAHRRAGYGRRCWSQLGLAILERFPSFCGFVNTANPVAHSFYERMGGTLVGRYAKVYV